MRDRRKPLPMWQALRLSTLTSHTRTFSRGTLLPPLRGGRRGGSFILMRMKNNSPTSPSRTPAQRVALYGALTALALVAGYVEMLVPLPVTVPGIKLGLGNIVVLFAIARLGARPALALMAAKVACTTILFANPQAFVFSLAGGILSWALMALAWKSGLFSCIATSVIGGIAHNVGQLAAVALVLSPQVAAVNLPVLAVAGVVCGAATGVLTQALLAAVPQGGIHE